MKKFSTLIASIALAAIIASPALATTSSINPTQPAQNAPLLSATIRALALAAYNDITAIFGDLTVSANQFLGSTAGGQAVGITIPNCPNGIGYVNGGGFVCASGTGITTLTGDVTATGPGSATAALANTATARLDIGLGLSSTPQFAGLTLTGIENINLNTGSLIAALTGTTLHEVNVDGAINRIQLDAFGNSAHFSALRADGTAASPTALQSADVIGSFNGWGYDGTTYSAASSWQIATSQIWTPSAHGSVASIWTTPNGTTTPVQQLVVNNDGGVTMPPSVTGGDQGAGKLNATGLCIGGDCNLGLLDVAQSFTKAQRATPNVPAISTSTFTADFSASNHFDYALTSACPCTIANPTNIVAGQSGVIEVDQDGSGSRTVTWGSNFKFSGATAPTLSTTASATDFFGYYVKDATHVIVGSGVLNAH